jgi:hypothetical protein
MDPIQVARILEIPVPNRRLGRHLQHDPRSRTFRVTRLPKLETKAWKRHGRIFDQAALGSCTGMAMAGVLMTEPFYRSGTDLVEDDAVELYELATRLDCIPGSYPPDDTGSTGLAVAKAAKRRGFLARYEHAFGLTDALHALQHGPILAGLPWYDSFDDPYGIGAELVITADAQARGGHEVEISEIDVEAKIVRGPNSWGEGWGERGYFSMTWSTLRRLLGEQGDVVRPIL